MGKANPMRYDCAEGRRCYNLYKRPKLEMLAAYLPGKCAFTDVDGLAEINGYGLLLEWKPSEDGLPILRGPHRGGQIIAYERLSQSGCLTVVAAAGDALTMEVTHLAWWWFDYWQEWFPATIVDLASFITDWVTWAQAQKRPPRLAAPPPSF